MDQIVSFLFDVSLIGVKIIFWMLIIFGPLWLFIGLRFRGATMSEKCDNAQRYASESIVKNLIKLTPYPISQYEKDIDWVKKQRLAFMLEFVPYGFITKDHHDVYLHIKEKIEAGKASELEKNLYPQLHQAMEIGKHEPRDILHGERMLSKAQEIEIRRKVEEFNALNDYKEFDESMLL